MKAGGMAVAHARGALSGRKNQSRFGHRLRMLCKGVMRLQ
jgi:hypothetical protein